MTDRATAIVAAIRAKVSDANVWVSTWGGPWRYPAQGEEVIAVDYTDQDIGVPGYELAVSWRTEAQSGWLSDADLPPPPRQPESQRVRNARAIATNTVHHEQKQHE